MSARRAHPGSVLMEFIIVAPLMLILISMILQFSQIWIARHITAYAAYCAARSVLSAGSKDDATKGAQCAAELACAWMSLAGLPSSMGKTHSSEEIQVYTKDRLHAKATSSGAALPTSTTETFYDEDSEDGVKGEIRIPGWGWIPGSDAAKDLYRVNTTLQWFDGEAKQFKTWWDSVSKIDIEPPDDNREIKLVRAKVEFKFPLLFPLAGRMISWFVNTDKTYLGRAGEVGYGTHNMSNDPLQKGWRGQAAVMDETGAIVDDVDHGDDWGHDGKFPAITLTEYCMLPMPYAVNKGFTGSYADLPRK